LTLFGFGLGAEKKKKKLQLNGQDLMLSVLKEIEKII
jgi:hypothetical protein